MKFLRPFLVIFSVLTLDQILKFWVKLHFNYGESLKIFNWFYIYFVENEGMAYGFTFGGEWGKLALSLFRLLAVTVIAVALFRLVKKRGHPGLIIALSLIFAGAMGNILDSVFYGVFFSESTQLQVAQLFPSAGGYETWLHGRVVDMLYFPLIEGFYPSWVPYMGGHHFVFFRPIFNVSDASITSGVTLIILFQKRFFKPRVKEVNKPAEHQTTDIPLAQTE